MSCGGDAGCGTTAWTAPEKKEEGEAEQVDRVEKGTGKKEEYIGRR